MADNDQNDLKSQKSAKDRNVDALIADARAAMADGGRSGGYSLAYTILTSCELSAEQEAEMYFLKGLGLFRMGNFRDAIADFDEVIFRDRIHAEAHHLRADCYREISDWRRAAEGYGRVIILQPDNALAYFRRATESDDSLARKIADLSEAVSAKPDFREAYEGRGRCYIDSRQFEQAVADFTRALELYPAWCDALCWRALSCYELGRYQEAIEDCDLYAEIGLGALRHDGVVQEVRNKAFAMLGRSETPILSGLNLTDGEVVRPEDVFADGGGRNGGKPGEEPGEELAEDWEALADAIDQASSFENNFEDQSSEALIDFALEAAQSDYGSSRRILASVNLVFMREASLPFKTRVELLMARGRALMAEREYEHAVRDFDWLIEADDRDVEAYRLRAEAYVQLGDTRSAIRNYTLMLAITPDDATALAHISWLLVIGGGLGEDAVSLARRAVKLDDSIWIRTNLAAAYAAAGDFEQAVAAQSEIVLRVFVSGDYAAIPVHQQALDYYRWGHTTWGNEHYTWIYQGLSERIRGPVI